MSLVQKSSNGIAVTSDLIPSNRRVRVHRKIGLMLKLLKNSSSKIFKRFENSLLHVPKETRNEVQKLNRTKKSYSNH